MNWDTLVTGLVFSLLGLIGLIFSSGLTKERKNSVTGGRLVFGTYAVLLGGLILVFLSFFSD